MLRLVLRLLGVDLDYNLAQIRVQLEEFKGRTTYQVAEQVKATGLMVGFAFVGAVAAIATFIIVLVALYRWADMYKGPFAALAAVGAVVALLATAMFALAFGRKPRKPDVDRSPTVAPPPSLATPQPMSVALSAALPPLPSNASVFNVLTHRFSTRVAGAGDEAVDAAFTSCAPALNLRSLERWRPSRWSAYCSGVATGDARL
jgi:hypothetical protein